jgi:thiol:disulfide interchange protein DsbC
LLAVLAQAGQAQAADRKVLQQISDRIAAARPDLRVVSIEETPMPGIYAAQIERGPVVYTNVDGSYFITGDLFKVEERGIVNLAEQKRDQSRKQLMATLDKKDMIVFSPKAPLQTKASITVFTDIDCGYCRKLHREVPELNKRGIEVRYMAYPRAGIGSRSYQKLVTAWCSDSPTSTLTALKNNKSVPDASCENPVAEHYEAGQRAGVTGTPALVTEDGQLLPGYMPADALAEALGVKS